MKRGGSLPRQSAKRKAEAPLRAGVRERVHERDGGCQAAVKIPGHVCASPFPDRPRLEVHEVEARGVHPGSHLVDDLCVLLCQAGHDAATEDPDSPEWALFHLPSTYDRT